MNAAVASGTRPRATPTLRARKRRELFRNLAFLSPWLLGTGLFFLYPLITVIPNTSPTTIRSDTMTTTNHSVLRRAGQKNEYSCRT